MPFPHMKTASAARYWRKRQAAPEITCHVEKSLASTLAIRNEELLEEVVALKTALETEPADAAMEEARDLLP